jgi:hypothetical protein
MARMAHCRIAHAAHYSGPCATHDGVDVMLTTKTKTCTSCGETHPESTAFFYKDPRAPGGFRSRCKWCSDLARANKMRAENKSPADYMINGVLCKAFKAEVRGLDTTKCHTQHQTHRGTRLIQFH